MREYEIFYELLNLISDEEKAILAFTLKSSKENDQKNLLIKYLIKYKKAISYFN